MTASRRVPTSRKQRIDELQSELSHWRRTSLTPETVSALCALEEELSALHESLAAEAQQIQCAFVFPPPGAIA